jgi:hypothetical protein
MEGVTGNAPVLDGILLELGSGAHSIEFEIRTANIRPKGGLPKL